MTKGSEVRHSTAIFASSVTENPLSPSQVNASVPLSVAVVKNVTNGLAAMAGKNTVEKISSPLYLHENDVMISRRCEIEQWSKSKKDASAAVSHYDDACFSGGLPCQSTVASFS